MMKIELCAKHPGLDCIFIWLGPAPPKPPSLPSCPARTCVGSLPRWEPGASIVKWTKKVLRYTEAMIFLVKRL
jgi:hypothetical protein